MNRFLTDLTDTEVARQDAEVDHLIEYGYEYLDPEDRRYVPENYIDPSQQ